MLSTATPFPTAGSYARAKGVRGTVRIQQVLADGSRLITGKHVGGGKKVALDELRAVKAPRS